MKKLLITLGPASLHPEIITKMTRHTPYVFRLNMSHVSLEQLPEHIDVIRRHSSVPVCIDSEGAQIRTYRMAEGVIALAEGAVVDVLADLEPGSDRAFSLTPCGIAAALREGDLLRLDWHGVTLRVIASRPDRVRCRVERGGQVASCKAVDVDRPVPLPAVTGKDKEAIRIGREKGVRHYALSFADRPEDVRAFRELAGPEAVIISKLESESALRNLAAILMETDEALIDRGDLSRAVPLFKIPFLQMRMVSMARALGKPLFVATNLLETMVEQPFPTRAELNDIAASILMGADGLVLAAESAVGRNPLRCVEVARSMLSLCEKWTVNSSIDDVLAM